MPSLFRAMRAHLSRRPNRDGVEAPAPASDRGVSTVDDLIELETEYDQYTRSLQRAIWVGVLVLGLAGLFVVLPTWMSGGTAKVPLVLIHINGDLGLAAFGILAAIVLALQVMVRTPSARQPDREFEARKKVLGLMAMFLVVINLGLGGYLFIQNSVAATLGVVDAVRTFGPLVGGIILAVLAADAASVVSRSSASKDRNAQDVRNAMRLREQVKALRSGSGRPLVWSERVVDVALLLVIPALIVLVLDLAATPSGIGQGIISGLIISGYCAAIYGVVYENFVAAARGTWSFLEATFVMPVIVFVAFALTLLAGITENSTAENWAARTAGGLLAFVAATVFPAATAWFLIRAGDENRRRGLLRDIAIWRAAAHLRTAEDHVTSTTSSIPWNKVAIASFVVSPAFPFGAILGTVARQQIADANLEGSKQRGSRLAAAAIVISCCVPLLVMIGLFVIIIVDPALQ